MFGLRDAASGVVSAFRRAFSSKAEIPVLQNRMTGLDGEVFIPSEPLPVPVCVMKDVTPKDAFT